MILQKCKNINFWKLVLAGVHPKSPSRPVKTSFQKDIKIYEDKLGQSGDMILSSHMINGYSISWSDPLNSYKTTRFLKPICMIKVSCINIHKPYSDRYFNIGWQLGML